MTILTRYMIRAHVGPFLFAFTAVTGLLFLNAVAQRLETLTGRGLEWSTFGEFMLLSLPHIVALTFPMSILVAVLYAFSDMTGHNEVSAMAAGGVHPVRLMVPLIGVGMILTGMMYVFNDHVLPESNHRLSSLIADIGSKSPTFELREDIVNEVHTGDDTRYFLRARHIDRTTNHLTDVTIFDLSIQGELRTIVASGGTMAFTPDLRDLFLTLDDGVMYAVADDRPGTFQWLSYDTQVLPFRGVGQELERRAGGTRGDREMPIVMLQAEVDRSIGDLARTAEESRNASMETVQIALGHDGRAVDPALTEEDIEHFEQEYGPDWAAELRAAGVLLDHDQAVDDVMRIHRTNAVRYDVQRLSAYRYRVEIHKKYAIAFACLIFVLLGPPMAIRFPQGGAGMVIAASVGIFFFYWMGLIGGERLADRGQMDPVVAMWLPNAVLGLPALYLMSTMARQISTNRGSAWDELRFRIGEALRFGRRTPALTAVKPESAGLAEAGAAALADAEARSGDETEAGTGANTA